MSSQDVGPSIREGSAVLVGANVLGEAGEAGTDLSPEGEGPVKDSEKHSMLGFFFPRPHGQLPSWETPGVQASSHRYTEVSLTKGSLTKGRHIQESMRAVLNIH